MDEHSISKGMDEVIQASIIVCGMIAGAFIAGGILAYLFFITS